MSNNQAPLSPLHLAGKPRNYKDAYQPGHSLIKGQSEDICLFSRGRGNRYPMAR